MLDDKELGAIYGALIGDACGCPYEFKAPADIPSINLIDMIPPKGFDRTYAGIPIGTYTDDGAQLLCLLESLIDGGDLVSTLTAKLYKWLNEGYMSVDNFTFDVGMQTQAALRLESPEKVKELLSNNKNSGNGSLMRCIPSALCSDDLRSAMTTGITQSLATHPSNYCQIACAVYAGIAWLMLYNDRDNITSHILKVFSILQTEYPLLKADVGYVYNYKSNEPTGTGFVVDSLWSSLHVLQRAEDYKDVIKHAIALGHDTDTTACIAGGLAGIKFGFSGIPSKWIDLLRDKTTINSLISRFYTKRASARV